MLVTTIAKQAPSQQWKEKRIKGDEQVNNNCLAAMGMALMCM